jgi:hypothetical protein
MGGMENKGMNAMSEIEKQITDTLAVNLERELPARMERTGNEDVSKFLATAERLLAVVREQISEAESRHAMARTKLTDEYRRKLERLTTEGQEELRRLDIDANADLEKRRRMLKALLNMRGE